MARITSGSMRDLAAKPFALMAAELCHAALMMGFTAHDSFWRLATLPFQLFTVWIAATQSQGWTYGGLIQPIMNAYAVTYVLDYVDRVLLQRWSFEAGGPTRTFDSDSGATGRPAGRNEESKPQSPDSFWARLAFGLDAATSRRHVNTPCEVKNCAHFSANDPSYVPSRSRFILGALGSVVACYLFIDTNDATAQSDQDISLFAAEKVPFFSRLGDVTVEEVVVKLVIAAVIWTTSYCMIRMTYDMVSIVAVGLRLTGVNAWRPVFGSIWDMYTVRRFWGSFWHQQLRDALNDPATILVHGILHLPPTGIAQRYAKVLTCFFLSGAVHVLVDLANGITYAESGALRFFTTQALGIVIEDGAQEMWRRLFGGGKSADDGNAPSSRWKRVVGFVWLWAFMAWTVPAWMFAPILARVSGEHGAIMGRLSLARWALGKN